MDTTRRALHPGAWWLWALGMATAASRTTNPLLLALVVAVVAFVVTARRGEAPWARGLRAYLVLGLVVVGIRVVFRAVLDAGRTGTILFRLPELSLPDAAQGISLGGPVVLESLVAAAVDGLALATMLLCIGAANTLADPKRLLKAVPGALHEIGVAVTVALTVAPQLVTSAQRVRRAQALRGSARRRRLAVIRRIALPVMTDALDRSLLLAAAMDSRGYGRRAAIDPRHRALSGGLVLAGLVGAAIGTYGLLDATTPAVIGLPMLLAGTGLAVAGLVSGGRRIQRTRYRPDPWRGPEWAVAASGVAAAATLTAVSTAGLDGLAPSLNPVAWPPLPMVPTLGVLAGLLPAWVAPRPALATTAGTTTAGPVPATDLRPRTGHEAARATTAGVSNSDVSNSDHDRHGGRRAPSAPGTGR